MNPVKNKIPRTAGVNKFESTHGRGQGSRHSIARFFQRPSSSPVTCVIVARHHFIEPAKTPESPVMGEGKLRQRPVGRRQGGAGDQPGLSRVRNTGKCKA